MKPFAAQSYYELLEISASASAADVRGAWQRLNRMYADDQVALYGLASPETAAALRKRLLEAMEVLADDELRAMYDEEIGLPPREATLEEPASQLEMGELLRGAEHSVASTHPRVAFTWSEPALAPVVAPPSVLPPPSAAVAQPAPSAPVAAPSGPVVADDPAPTASSPVGPPHLPVAAPSASALAASSSDSAPHVPAADPHVVAPPPSAPVAAPSAPVAALIAEIAAPIVLVAAPSAPVAAPSAPVAAPSAPVAAPSAPVAAPSAPVAAPSAPFPAPRGSEAERISGEGALSMLPRASPAPRASAPPAAPERPRMPDLGPDAEYNGELLRKVRTALGLSLSEVAERTRIGAKHLENVEADRYAALPATVYLRGILMSLAKELRLDGLTVARSYLLLVERIRSKG